MKHMTQATGRLAALVLAAGLPAAAWAQDVVIRLEAKRDAAAAATAARDWAARFDGVVTLPLDSGWTAIAIGPLPRDRAGPLLDQLKQAGKVPGDAFVSEPASGTMLTPVDRTAPRADAAPQAAPVPQGLYMRLQSFSTLPEAQAALQDLRRDLPAAGLWELPDGWFALTLGPVSQAAGQAWLPVLSRADLIPDDASLAPAAGLGRQIEAGADPRLPAPPAEVRPLPPLDQVQRALRWGGHYTGRIDGTDGPMTRTAIQAEITGSRASTDPGTAIAALEKRRAEWARAQGLEPLVDDATGLRVTAPMRALQFDRAERALSIYGPKDGSGAALILFSQLGGQQELLDLAGLVTALGWVPAPQRMVSQGHVTLNGTNDTHIGAAEGWVRDGRAEGFVLIWPASDAQTQTRLLAEISDSLTRVSVPDAPSGPALP